jgi:uncharacterized phage protein (TIGR01671 family)
MKREILFRGKRTDNNNWIEGGYCLWNDYRGSDRHVIMSKTGFNNDIHPETIGQYIGLLDKNDTKIFEGDIVKQETDKAMVVSWNNRFSSFCLDRDGWAFSHWFGEYTDPSKCEVIGNIHDNPELLKN